MRVMISLDVDKIRSQLDLLPSFTLPHIYHSN
jgi:hypothetical protein